MQRWPNDELQFVCHPQLIRLGCVAACNRQQRMQWPKIIKIRAWVIGRKWTNQDCWCITSTAEHGYTDYRDYDTWMRWCMDTGWRWRCYTVDDVLLGHLRLHYPKAQSLTAVRYLNIVADQVLPFMATVFLAGDGHYQQDNALCHNASIVKEQLEEHDSEFLLMPWPPNSPDMNHEPFD